MILKKINYKMGKNEWEMFQDLPNVENGAHNICNGLPFEAFIFYLEQLQANEYLKMNNHICKTITYIAYNKNIPIGYVGIRPSINKQWREWGGNIFYAVRLSQRNKGFGTQMCKHALKLLKEFGLKTIYCSSSENNIASQRVLEKCGGIFLYEDDGTRYYKFNI